MQESLEEVIGLAQQLVLNRVQALVPRRQPSELFLQRKRRNRNFKLFQLFQIDGWLCRASCPAVGLSFSERPNSLHFDLTHC
jgi:hypothetical protein